MQTWSDAQSALLAQATSGVGQKGVTHEMAPPTMSMQAHSPPAHPAPHGGSDEAQVVDTAWADAGVADPRIMGAT